MFEYHFNSAILWKTLTLCAFSLFLGCEDEQPAAQRGGAPPVPAAVNNAAPATAGTPSATEGAKAKNAALRSKSGDKDKSKANKRVSRAPTASDVLGLDAGNNGKGKVAAFLRPPQNRTGPNPLFAGVAAQPSSAYAGLKLNVIEVSPLERYWGKKNQWKKAKQKAKTVILSLDDAQVSSFLDHEKTKEAGADTPKDGRKAKATVDGKRFPLLMYKFDPQTGRVETFKRNFASEEARESARRFAKMSGYSETLPSKQVVEKARAKARAVKAGEDAKKAAEQAAKKAKVKEEKKTECAFRATWYQGSGESRTSRSQCFDSRAALDAFMAARKKDAESQKKNAPSKPKPKDDDSLTPVKIE